MWWFWGRIKLCTANEKSKDVGLGRDVRSSAPLCLADEKVSLALLRSASPLSVDIFGNFLCYVKEAGLQLVLIFRKNSQVLSERTGSETAVSLLGKAVIMSFRNAAGYVIKC